MFIGIDLGTTQCCIAYKNPNTNSVEVIDNPQRGGKSIPSVISFFNNEIGYNIDAINKKRSRPECCVYDAKRFIGRTYDNVEENFDINKMNFELKKNVNNKPSYEIDFKGKKENLFPEQISALLLGYLKSITEQIVNKIEGCVITVPAHFNNIEREATLFAAEMADLNVLQLLNEPSAAAISYGHANGIKTGFILVFDFGGGTLDVSIVHKQNEKYDVVGYAGDQILGGRDIDNAILDYCIKQFQTMYSIEHNNAKKRAILLEKCESAKIILSEVKRNQTEIFDWNENDSIILTKNKLEEICQPFFVRSMGILETFLNKVKMEKNQIDVIVMTGGSSRIPLIQKMVTDFFGRQPLCHDPEAAIAKGAALVAFDYSQKYSNFNLVDQVRYSIGKDVKNREIKDGPALYTVIIEAGTKIPCSGTIQCVTVYDNQKSAGISIAEGESKYFYGNTFIDSFRLENLPPGKAGEISMDVTIEINKSGLMLVTATETSKKVTKSKEMKREGNYYNLNEKKQINDTFLSLLK
jgi:molecular chaperone DnaK (HSP70)